MPGTVLNKLRLQKFIIDVAIFFIPRTERETEKETGSERDRHRTETGESPSRGRGVDRLRRRPRSGLRLLQKLRSVLHWQILYHYGHLCVCVYTCAHSCPTLHNPMDYNKQGSSIHGIFQARILGWVVIFSFSGSS